MNLLFDTHTFIWWASEPAQLSERVLTLCQNPENTLFLSVVSVWEMQIKSSLGKLSLAQPLAKMIEKEQTQNAIQVLHISLAHVLALQTLPDYHKDPFDRLLVAQAKLEDAILLSKDALIEKYPVEVIW